jgi:2-alkyl-3-oxoalkanoate reductase
MDIDTWNSRDVTADEEDTMRVFVTGASGVIGRRLVPQLIEAGHEVIGTHNRPEGSELLRALGATPVRLDLRDVRAVRKAVLENQPDAIVHEATALAGAKFGRSLDKAFAATNELRTRGTDAVLAAAWEAGVRRVVGQSFAPYRYQRTGGPIKTEQDPLDENPPASMRASFAAMAHNDRVITEYGGIALRYGAFYGTRDDGWSDLVRRRKMPIVGDGSGIMSFIHVDDAASATVLALEHEGPAVYNIVDDDPAPAREWLPELSRVLGVKPPRRFPVWMARLVAGEGAVVMAVESRGVSNAKAKRELDWTPRYASWRQGFPAGYGARSVPGQAAPRAATRAGHSH